MGHHDRAGPGVSGPGLGAESAGGHQGRRRRGGRQVRADKFRVGGSGRGQEAAVPGAEGRGHDAAEREGTQLLEALEFDPVAKGVNMMSQVGWTVT